VSDPNDIDIPIVWLSLEDAADQLIASAYGRVSNADFAYRAARDVLALSLLMGGHTRGMPSHDKLTSIRPHLIDGSRWWRWCATNLQTAVAALSTADRNLVDNALRWLTGTPMLIATIPSTECACTPHQSRIGVQWARHIVDRALTTKP
jgi:hypothetical protein